MGIRDQVIDRGVFIAVAVFVLFLIIFGFYFHPIEELYSGEQDYYVTKADHLLSGRLPIHDAIHPLFYPFLVAAASPLIGDTFAAARLVSTLSAGGFVLLTYLLGRYSFNRKVALFAFLASLLNYHVIIEGVHASSDMTASALLLLAFFLLIKAARTPSVLIIIFMSLALALAYFTRYTAILFLPAFLIGLLRPDPARPLRGRMLSLGLFIITLLIFLLPHFYLNHRIFGDPFYNENYWNLAMKLKMARAGEKPDPGSSREDEPSPPVANLWEWSYLGKNEFTGFIDVVRRDPSAFLISGGSDLFQALCFRLPELGGGGGAGVVLTILFFAGAGRMLYCRRREGLLYLSAFLLMIGGISFSSIPLARHLLPLLSIFYIIAATSFLDRPAVSRWRIFLGAAVIMSLLLPLKSQVTKFISRHPIPELRAAQMLEERFGPGIKVAGTFPFIKRYVNYSYFHLADARGIERNDNAVYYRKLKQILATAETDYLIIGHSTIKHRPRSLIRNEGVPPFLHLIYHTPSVMVYRVEMNRIE